MPPERTHTLQVTISPKRIADSANERVWEYFSQGDRAVEECILESERVIERLEERIGERIGESIGGVISEHLAMDSRCSGMEVSLPLH